MAMAIRFLPAQASTLICDQNIRLILWQRPIIFLIITLTTYVGLAQEGESSTGHYGQIRRLKLFRLISIMLSRLRMGVEDCIDEYLHLGGSVFGSPRIFHSMTVPFLTKRTKYRSKLLTAAIQQVIRKHDDSRTEHTEHLFKSHPRACQTYVIPRICFMHSS